MSGYEAYQIYQAVRLHFSSDTYNYFTYNGKSKTSEDAFNARKDKYTFHKLARMYSERELPIFLAVNFLKNDKLWISDLVSDRCEKIFRNWLDDVLKRLELFERDFKKIIDLKLENLIVCKDGQFPELLNLVMQNEIDIHTLLLLDNYIHLMESWNAKIGDDFIWTNFYRKFKKYKVFYLHYAPLSDPYYKKFIVNCLTIKN